MFNNSKKNKNNNINYFKLFIMQTNEIHFKNTKNCVLIIIKIFIFKNLKIIFIII